MKLHRFPNMKAWLFLGAVFGGLAVAAGAFAAHGLGGYFAAKYGDETRIVAGQTVLRSAKYLHDFRTGAEYQLAHSLALLAVGLLAERRRTLLVSLAGVCFVGGIVLFSGSLYALTLTGVPAWGMVTPIGGVLFLAGWICLAAAAWRSPSQS